ncbi:LON peptidase N-terminal domain and RING finger protein 2 [Loxodonta africana]|uniref:LON peptidase N-terminal domain and RING finger protein 2 n=1 Tax=Loxodonta africana TaxID=9785 RepID=UPI0030D550E5
MSTAPSGAGSDSPPHQCLGCDYGDSIPVRIEKGDEAFRRGEYSLAAEIFCMLLPRVDRPDRGLCLRLGNSLARGGRVHQAMGPFRAAALFEPLQPHELGHLATGLARFVREREWVLRPLQPDADAVELRWGRPPSPPPAAAAPTPATLRALLRCPRCPRLLYEPVTLLCGRTVCKSCVEPGAVQPSREPQVNAVLSNLLEKCFPTEIVARRLDSQARDLQRQQQTEAALLTCQQALDLVPDDNSVLLLRAEIYLALENFEQALQDTSEVSQNEPFWIEGHHIKAEALSRLGRTKEMLKEFIYCLALNPEFQPVKEETQKVICELLFPNSRNVHQNSASSIPSGTLNTGLMSQSSSHASASVSPEWGHSAECVKVWSSCSFLRWVIDFFLFFDEISLIFRILFFLLTQNPSSKAYVFRDINSSVLYFLMGRNYKEDEKMVDSVLSIKPSTGLKRQFPDGLEDVPDVDTPGKTPKKDFLPQGCVDLEMRGSPGFSIDVTDFRCSFCMRLFFEPVTTPCGHTFCLKCFERSLNHAPRCPLCGETFPEFLLRRNLIITPLIEEIISRYLSDDLYNRKKIYDEEMNLPSLTRDIPIFLCSAAFPVITCVLHVSEPWYQLMIRRCMETGLKRFGMCLSTENRGISEFGCTMEIQDVRSLPDGSIDVDALRASRFRVLRYRRRDGYNTADIEYFGDEKVEGPEYANLVSLHDSVYQQSVSWFAGLQDRRREQLISHFGSMPDKDSEPQSHLNGPAWSWWVLAVLPLEQKAQVALLGMTSLRERLLIIRRIQRVTLRTRSSEELANTRWGNN